MQPLSRCKLMCETATSKSYLTVGLLVKPGAVGVKIEALPSVGALLYVIDLDAGEIFKLPAKSVNVPVLMVSVVVEPSVGDESVTTAMYSSPEFVKLVSDPWLNVMDEELKPRTSSEKSML